MSPLRIHLQEIIWQNQKDPLASPWLPNAKMSSGVIPPTPWTSVLTGLQGERKSGQISLGGK